MTKLEKLVLAQVLAKMEILETDFTSLHFEADAFEKFESVEEQIMLIKNILRILNDNN